ncbi:hypothetical protein ABW19_dt0207606 [Dactylella cylindrospora]|nr:hypothetical protein ABW19_dt0207606 [Dactylella cylindrospora]
MAAHPQPTLDSTIIQVVRGVIDFVDDPDNAGLDENLFDVFERSIADKAREETHCYSEFCEAQREQQGKSIDALDASENIVNEKISDITREVAILREIKDIRDELKMIQKVLEDQKTVLTQYHTALAKHDSLFDAEKTKLENLRGNLDFRVSKLHRLAKDASSVENSVRISRHAHLG